MQPTRRISAQFFSLKSVVIGLLAFFVFGCTPKRVYERLDDALEDVTKDQIAYANATSTSQSSLSWEAALQLLNQRNSQLRRSQTRIDDLEEERKQFTLRELSPRLTAVANLSSALSNLASVDSDSVGIQLLGGIQIPDPFSVYARRYALELQYYTSKLEHEELVRRTYSQLYETFLTQIEVDRAKLELKRTTDQQASLPSVDRNALRKLLQGSGRKQQQAERRANTLRRRISSLLNSPNKEFYLRHETLPKFDYQKRYSKLSFESGFGELALKQTAGAIESARANLWRVKVNRYPPLNVNLSLPTIYNSRTDETPAFEDISLFTGSSKSFEFTGQEARTVRSAEERAQSINDQIQVSLSNEAQSFKQLKSRYENLLKAEDRLARQLDYYEKNPPLPSASLISNRIEEVWRLKDELANFKSFRRRLELEFWVWDEKYWDSPF